MSDNRLSGLLRGKYLPILLCFAAGAVLLWIGITSDRGGSEPPEEAAAGAGEETERWCAHLEEEARRLCESVAGISDVTVVITACGGFEQVYAKNTEIRGSDRTETYAAVGSGSAARLCTVRVLSPEIAGIGVTCRGAGDPGVRAELCALLGAAFGVSVSKIHVTQAG